MADTENKTKNAAKRTSGPRSRRSTSSAWRRRAKWRELGFNPYGNGYRPEHLAAEILAKPRHASPPRSSRRPRPPPTTSPAASWPCARFGKAAFIKLRDRSGEIQVHMKKDALGDAYELFKLSTWATSSRRQGTALPHQDGRADPVRHEVRAAHQVPAPAAGEVARPHGRGDPLPPALPGPGLQPGREGDLPQAHQAGALHPGASSTRGTSSRWRPR